MEENLDSIQQIGLGMDRRHTYISLMVFNKEPNPRGAQ